MLDDATIQVAATGFGGKHRLEDLLFLAQKSGRIAPMQLLRHDRVVGWDHVRHAAKLAQRAMADGRNHAKTLDVEFLRYASGERQIKQALEKMGLKDPVEGGIVVAMGPKRNDALQHFLHAVAEHANDALLVADLQHLADFGIEIQQLDATTPDRRIDLVLEAVALVDVQRNG
jgi:KEOPS complex subunit Cgi121